MVLDRHNARSHSPGQNNLNISGHGKHQMMVNGGIFGHNPSYKVKGRQY
jgi:hypothetical protein